MYVYPAAQAPTAYDGTSETDDESVNVLTKLTTCPHTPPRVGRNGHLAWYNRAPNLDPATTKSLTHLRAYTIL